MPARPPNDDPRTLDYETPPPTRPLWVQLGLLGVGPGLRAATPTFLALSAVIVALLAARGLRGGPILYFFAAVFVLALWQWAAVRWVERHADWD